MQIIFLTGPLWMYDSPSAGC